MLTLFFLTMLCNFVVEISVGGLAWCLKQTQKIFFFWEKQRSRVCLLPKKFWVPFNFYNQSYCIFFKNNGLLLSERKHPKLRQIYHWEKINNKKKDSKSLGKSKACENTISSEKNHLTLGVFFHLSKPLFLKKMQ